MSKVPDYRQVIQQTAQMVSDRKAQKLAATHGLQIVNVTWEDTGRFSGSSVGANISDMTIQVQSQIPGTEDFELTCMPVIRFPNFSDVTGDIAPDLFYLLVGNEADKPLEKVTLREFLSDIRRFLHDPSSWAGSRSSMLADERDSHVLVSAQACFLPIPKEGTAEFNPVLFNYQSTAGDPAVLTILATREGTSVTVIDNQRDAFQAGDTWGQRLFFNENGQRASLTGQRQSDFVATDRDPSPGNKDASPAGLNMVLLIQVPLKQKNPVKVFASYFDEVICCMDDSTGSDVEEAVIGHGRVEGPFTEIDNLEIERDDRFPTRVTVQFYKATSNGVVNEADLADIAAQIKRVYEEADYVGSLVVDGQSNRPTEHSATSIEPPDWWMTFWKRHQQNTGQSENEAKEMLEGLLGKSWADRTAQEVEDLLADILAKKA